MKEGIKPNYHGDLEQPKINSVVVVPKETKRTIKDLIPVQKTPRLVNSGSTSSDAQPTTKTNRNRNGSAKRKAKQLKLKGDSAGSLTALLARVNVAHNDSRMTRNSTPKRHRSPDEVQSQPKKLAKALDKAHRDGNDTRENQISKPSYRDILKTMKVKICLADRYSTGKDLANIKEFLLSKIEDAIEQKKYIPVLKDCHFGKDGLYVTCPDSECMSWLVEAMESSTPKINSKLMIVSHDHQVNFPEPSIMVRVVIRLPTRRPADFILGALAEYNPNLNTEKWRIARCRPKGTSSSTVFMRMDKTSFDIIGQQNNEIYWLLGPLDPIIVETEHQRPKPKNGNSTSRAPEATVSGSSTSGNPIFKPCPSRVMAVNQLEPGSSRKKGPNQNGNSNPNKNG